MRAVSSYSACGAPKLGFYSGQDKAERVWGGVLHIHGLYISVFSPRKTLAVKAIRDLAQAAR